MKTMRAWTSGIAMLLLTGCATNAANLGRSSTPLNYLPALRGDYLTLRAPHTGTTFHVYIRYPEGYSEAPTQRYPIVYLLDGDSTFPLLAPEHLFIHYDDKLPEAIIVGVAYGSFDPSINHRHFDFSPPSGKSDEGGAPAFERFLRDRVIPAVESRTRADPSHRILVGQSRGGGFVFYSAFIDPDLFWARIASSPTLTPGREIYFGVPASAHRKDLKFVVADGTNDYPDLRRDTVEWELAWSGRKGPWELKTLTLDGGTHAADLPTVYRKAMNWLFQ
ncbi:MAG: alpha/beta hydrolase-fold protein, partial [Sphingomicrobium sp.]